MGAGTVDRGVRSALLYQTQTLTRSVVKLQDRAHSHRLSQGLPVGITPDRGLTLVNEVQFLNPETRVTETWCTEWYDAYIQNTLMSTGAIGAVVAINSILKIVLKVIPNTSQMSETYLYP